MTFVIIKCIPTRETFGTIFLLPTSLYTDIKKHIFSQSKSILKVYFSIQKSQKYHSKFCMLIFEYNLAYSRTEYQGTLNSIIYFAIIQFENLVNNINLFLSELT